MARFIRGLTIFLLAVAPLFAARKRSFDIPAGTADRSLRIFIEQAGVVNVIYPAAFVRGVPTPAVKGEFEPAEALRRLLASTGLTAKPDDRGTTFLVTREVARAAQEFGTIEGSVRNSDAGRYLSGVRISVDGTGLETFTDSSGSFRIGRVPVGNVLLRVFYTGSEPQLIPLAVAAGETIRRDFDLGVPSPGTEANRDEVVSLENFVVTSRQETDAAEIAINEQRIAPNQKFVVSADEFGGDPEGNLGEFLKFLPGVSVEYDGGNARNIDIEGVPGEYVPFTVLNLSLASPGQDTGTDRSVALDFLSLNNLARIELEYSPTPDSQGGALAGTVNLVPRSAFEKVRPEFEFRTFLTMRDNALDFQPSPGPFRGDSRKVHPGAEFSYVVPVSPTFGFTVSAQSMMQYSTEDILTNTWRGLQAPTNGTTFPDTTPDRPYLTSVQITDGGKETTRQSVSVTFDFKLGGDDVLTLGYFVAATQINYLNRNLIYNITDVASFTTSSTQSTVGGGNVQMLDNGRLRNVLTYMPYLAWKHDGTVWNLAGGLGLSHASNLFRDIQDGRFISTTAERSDLTVGFKDFSGSTHLPGEIAITDGPTGEPVDEFSGDSYALVSASSNEVLTVDQKRTAYFTAQRDFDGPVPLSIRAGLDLRDSTRDTAGTDAVWSYVGPDGQASTTPVGTDNGAGPFIDLENSFKPAPFGFPRIPSLNNWAVWSEYQAHPTYFVENQTTAYTNAVNLSKYAEELVSAAFLRGDVAPGPTAPRRSTSSR